MEEKGINKVDEKKEFQESLETEEKRGRIIRCSSCKHGSQPRAGEKWFICPHTGKRTYVIDATNCEHYDPRISMHPLDGISKSTYDGLPIRNTTLLDLRTRNQWMESGYWIKPGEVGWEMHPSALAKRTFIYYLPEQVEVFRQRKEREEQTTWH